MKKILSFILCSVLLVIPLVPTVAADFQQDETLHFEDGSYLKITFNEVIQDEPDWSEDQDIIEESAESFITRIINWFKKIIALITNKKTVMKTKYAYYYDANGSLLWRVYLTAEFTYNGKKAECNKADTSWGTKDSDWKLVSSDCSKSGNTATGTFTVRQYKLGVPLKVIEKTLTLTCDKNGNVK